MNICTKKSLGMALAGLLLALAPLTAGAQVEYNGLYYNLNNISKTAEVTSDPNLNYYYGNVTIPETITYGGETYTVTAIGPAAFQYCYALYSVSIPQTVTLINTKAFYNCGSLTSLNIPDKVTYIGNFAFWHCSGLQTLTLPANITYIGNECFNNCVRLQSVTLPQNLTTLGYGAFYYCSSLTSVTIPESLTTIQRETFNGCSNLASVTFSKSLVSIGNQAFMNCSSLKSVVIANNLTTIGMRAFYKCTALEMVNIGSSLQMVGGLAFADCTSLSDFYCYTVAVPVADEETFSGSNVEKASLYVPQPAIAGYASTSPWNKFGSVQEMDAPYYIYAICSENNWTKPHTLKKVGKTSTYQGYCYLKGEMRIKPYEEWDDEWGYDSTTGKLVKGSSENIPVPAEGFYQVTVDLASQTCSLLQIKMVSIAGDFNNWGDTTDVDMTYNKSNEAWTVTKRFDAPSKFKFRANRSWKLNWGGTPENIMTNGDSLFASVASYKFDLYLTYDGNSHLTMTKLTDTEQCKKPTISFDKGELVFASATKGAEYNYTIGVDDNKNGKGSRVALSALYTISVYATAPGYADSEVAKATIGWKNGKPTMEGFQSIALDEDKMKGDVNGDGNINIGDITSLIAIIAAQAEAETEPEPAVEPGQGEGDDGNDNDNGNSDDSDD